MRTDLGWRLDPSVTFLNHGSYGACPEPVLAVQRALGDRLESEPVRFLSGDLAGLLDDARSAVGRFLAADPRVKLVYLFGAAEAPHFAIFLIAEDRLESEPVRFLSGDLAGLLDETRSAVGRFLGADPDGLAFVANATTGYNAVLQSLRFAPGDELLTNDHEYNATINAIRAVAARDGARVVVTPIPFPLAGPEVVRDAILGAVTDRTRLVVVSHVTSPTALIFPIAEIVSALAARGIDTLVDGAHAPGMVPVELDTLGAAYWTGNGHKWLCGPKGAAVLWVRADRRESIHPLVVSHGANAVLGDRTRFRHEFDWVGTADPTGFLTLPAAIDWMADQAPGGWPEVMASNRALALYGRDRLCDALGIVPPAPDPMIGSMAMLLLPWVEADDEAADRLHDRLETEARIQVPIGMWPVPAARTDGVRPQVFLRLSAQRYNEPADYDRLAEALVRMR